jgi:hypothetical protein
MIQLIFISEIHSIVCYNKVLYFPYKISPFKKLYFTDLLRNFLHRKQHKWKMLAVVDVNKNNSLVQVSTRAPSDAQSVRVLWASSDWCVPPHLWQRVLHQTRTAIPHYVSLQIPPDTYTHTSHTSHSTVPANRTDNSTTSSSSSS